MGQQIVTHSCGHTVTHNLFGKHVDRDKKAAWLETVPCAECKAREEAGPNVKEIEMHYREYKNRYADCKTVPGSYDQDAKTIIVLVPQKETENTAKDDAETSSLPAIQAQDSKQRELAERIRSKFLDDLKKITAKWGEHIVIARTQLDIGPVLDFYGKPVDADEFRDACKKMLDSDADLADEVEEVKERITRYLGVTSAKWWIANAQRECGSMCCANIKTP